MVEKVKFGVVGVGVPRKDVGWIAQMHYFVPSIAWARYFPQISKNPNAELTAICDVVKERLEDVAKVYEVKETFTDYKAMLEKSDIDAVIITTPNKYHFPMALDAIKAGKHLIVEKPLTTNAQEAKVLVEEAKKKKVKLFPMPYVFDNCFYKIREMIDKGFLGKICLLRGKVGHMGPGHGEWFYKSGFGAGAMFDLAVYPATTFTALIGPAKRVIAVSGTAIEKRLVTEKEIDVEVEDNLIISLDFGNGRFGDIVANYCTQINYGPSLEVYGSRGAAFVENGYLKFLTSSNDVRGLLTSQSPLAAPFPDEPIIERFIHYVQRDIDISYLGEQQTHVIEILEKALESSNKTKALEITTTFNPNKFVA
ncbi:MAG: Gfo/Idh/MocA family oxidoreductase [Candidatus Bathyarchaeia archaeon]